MTISENFFLIIFSIFLVVNNGNLENSSKWKKMANKTWEMGIVFHLSIFAEVLEPSTAHLIIFKYLTNHQFFPRTSLPISHFFLTQTSPACLWFIDVIERKKARQPGMAYFLPWPSKKLQCSEACPDAGQLLQLY